MVEQTNIPRKKPGVPADLPFDHQALASLGLQHVERLARRVWTDYNVHDPGITTLELLCFALTDLGYRASYPVEDLLATASNNAASMEAQFFSAAKILPSAPLTALDYRKLVADDPEIKNAWIAPAPIGPYFADTIKSELHQTDPGGPGIVPVWPRGLYRVTLEYDLPAGSDPAVEKPLIQARLRALLNANRNLGEDFAAFAEVKEQKFNLCTEILLENDADAAAIEAEILFRVERYLAPSLRQYSLSAILEGHTRTGKPRSALEIFDGPPLQNGFFDDEELAAAELVTEIHLSDVIALIMDIPGVAAVRDVLVSPTGVATPVPDKWRVAVNPGEKAVLERTSSRFVFYKDYVPVVARAADVDARYAALVAEEKAESAAVGPFDFPIPLGSFRNPSVYESFQKHFPAVYGIGDAGLPAGGELTGYPELKEESARRAARERLAQQLQAYLLFFDQVMANYFAQLANVRELFSTDPALGHTYFSQAVKALRNLGLYAWADADNPTELQAAVEDPTLFVERRNRFLDHLIARFAERFHDYVQIVRSTFGASDDEVIAAKCDLLRNYLQVSGPRGLGYDYALNAPEDLWKSENVSGLEKRLAKLLGIADFRRRNLGDISGEVHFEMEQTAGNTFRFHLQREGSAEGLLDDAVEHPDANAALVALGVALEAASSPAGYRAADAGGQFGFEVLAGNGDLVARGAQTYASAAARDAATAELARYLSGKFEGMFLLENILLRPEQLGDPMVHVHLAPDCHDCAELDPYTYRVQVILPAYGRRFGNMNFRRFVEETIRTEMPAHIAPKVCWIDRESMLVLEPLYRTWIELRAGAVIANRTAALESFLNKLCDLKNVYPKSQLFGCDHEDKFILGRTALGTKD